MSVISNWSADSETWEGWGTKSEAEHISHKLLDKLRDEHMGITATSIFLIRMDQLILIHHPFFLKKLCCIPECEVRIQALRPSETEALVNGV